MKEILQFYGISHREANVAIREKFALGKEDISQFYYHFHELDSIKELFILSTCNRTEFYMYGKEDKHNIQWIIHQYQRLNRPLNKNLSLFQSRIGHEVISHSFKVASGVESMILGETQITAQVKDSLAHAQHSGSMGSILNRLINTALECSKAVRNQTTLSAGTLSVSSAAVDNIKKQIKDFTSKTILLVGAGSTGRLTALNLKKKGIQNIFITNRNKKNSQKLADDIGGLVVDYKEKADFLKRVDVLITCTSASKPVFTIDNFTSLTTKLFIVDLSIPRIIQPEVSQLSGIQLFTIDGLDEIIKDNIEIRKKELPEANRIIFTMQKDFQLWLRTLAVTPTIKELRSYYDNIKQDALEQIQNKYPPATVKILESVSDSLINKMLKTQIESLKTHGKSENSSTEFVENVRSLYQLDHPENGKN